MTAMLAKSPQGELFERVLSELEGLGYRDELLARSYRFEDWFLPGNPEREAPAAAFGQTPLSYGSACFAVLLSNGKSGAQLVNDYRSLGAPRAFEIQHDKVLHWRVSSDAATKSKPLVIKPEEIGNAFRANAALWRPESVMRAKNIGPLEPGQPDFVDFGLIPALEQHVRLKLDPLVRGILYEATVDYESRRGQAPNADELFRLVFRAIAGKVMRDRGLHGFQFDGVPDPEELLRKVAAFYNDYQPTVNDPFTRRLVVEGLWKSFGFKNLSVDVLAFVWENTLVDDEVRERLGIHATPPSVARYIVRRLPIREIPQHQRRVVEPCCGSGTFLLAALQRLRELLEPQSMPSPARHEYYKQMLSGFDIETFGLEAARHCLMLADFPNPDGWDLQQEDVFDSPEESPKFYGALKVARIVLCNPPFERFQPEHRARYKLRSVYKPVELLGRILDHLDPSGLLGFVLPRQALDGTGYRDIRQRLAERYDEIEVVELPDKVFEQAEQETALLMARRPRMEPNATAILHRKVDDADWRLFSASHAVTREDAGGKSVTDAAESFSVPDLEHVWRRLADHPTVDEVTGGHAHRGIEWNIRLSQGNKHLLVSQSEKPEFARGIASAPKGRFFSYQCPPAAYLCMKQEYRLYSAFDRPWHLPKVVMNAKRRSRSPWRIAAFADESGLVCYQTFTALWPSGDWTPAALAAVLNGPVANAYVAAHEGTRDITLEIIKEIPLPRLDRRLRERIEMLVAEYTGIVERFELEFGLGGRNPDRVLREIDASVLEGYELPPRIERELLDYFNGHGDKRPVPFHFLDYFPRKFRPCFSLTEFLSEEFALGTAGEFRKRRTPPPEDVLRALRAATKAGGD